MPEIARFYGMEIWMYPNDHHPAHFHALYNELEAAVAISPFGFLGGALPARCEAMLREWVMKNEAALMQAWQAIRDGQKAAPVAPLE